MIYTGLCSIFLSLRQTFECHGESYLGVANVTRKEVIGVCCTVRADQGTG